MGRVTFAFGTPDCGTGIMDGFSDGQLCPVGQPRGDSAVGTDGSGPALPGPVPCSREGFADENPQAEPELNHIWLELSASERQRFGHCFSFMVLKALGLRPCRTQEVQA